MKKSKITDKIRLDFLASKKAGLNSPNGGDVAHVWVRRGALDIAHYSGKTYREAIDKAMVVEVFKDANI